MILTCIGQGTSLRWRFRNSAGVPIADCFFLIGDELQTVTFQNMYYFTLVNVSRQSSSMESTFQTMVTNVLNDAIADCTDHLSTDTVTIRIAGLIIHATIIIIIYYVL